MALIFRSIKVVAWAEKGWRIAWTMTGVEPIMVFRIFRSDGAKGPWEQVGETPWNQMFFEDAIYTRSFNKRYFWRIQVVVPGTTTPTVTPDTIRIETHPFTIESEHSRILSEAIRQHEYRLRPFNGRLANFARRFAVYKRTSWSDPCHFCVDPVTGDEFLDHCPECLGARRITGWTVPQTFTAYFTQPFNKSTDHGQYGKSQTRENVLRIADWPILEEEDFLVERHSNVHWKVTSIMTTEPSGVLVSQNATVIQMPYDFVEMRLPYPEGQD